MGMILIVPQPLCRILALAVTAGSPHQQSPSIAFSLISTTLKRRRNTGTGYCWRSKVDVRRSPLPDPSGFPRR